MAGRKERPGAHQICRRDKPEEAPERRQEERRPERGCLYPTAPGPGKRAPCQPRSHREQPPQASWEPRPLRVHSTRAPATGGSHESLGQKSTRPGPPGLSKPPPQEPKSQPPGAADGDAAGQVGKQGLGGRGGCPGGEMLRPPTELLTTVGQSFRAGEIWSEGHRLTPACCRSYGRQDSPLCRSPTSSSPPSYGFLPPPSIPSHQVRQERRVTGPACYGASSASWGEGGEPFLPTLGSIIAPEVWLAWTGLPLKGSHARALLTRPIGVQNTLEKAGTIDVRLACL